MENPLIEVQGLSKQYRLGGAPASQGLRHVLQDAIMHPSNLLKKKKDSNHLFWALQDINFSVKSGDTLGIVGRNGAGKSTLLKILSRITEPTKGRISLRGRIASLLEVGTGFHPDLTGRENIFLNGAILGMSRTEIQKNFDAIVDFADVSRFLDTPVKRYSSGMYMRLAFAVAAHLESEILVIDEVLAVGDASFQKKCLGKMGQIAHQDGRTVLFVSHNMNAVEDLCNSCILLEKGRIKAASTDVRSVIQSYLSSTTSSSYQTTGEWVNQENAFESPYFQPTRFTLCNKAGEPLPMPVRNDEEMYVRIEGKVNVSDEALMVGYSLFNTETNNCLYISNHTDSAVQKISSLETGFWSITSRLPSRLLNEGTYRLELITALYYREWISKPGVNAPTIFLNIQGGLSDSPYWMNPRNTLIAPLISWTTQRTEQTL